MKFLLSVVAIFALFYGCSQTQSPNLPVSTNSCPAPYAKIHLDTIQQNQNDLKINPEFIKTLLDKNLKDNCLSLSDTSGDGIYELSITYKTSLQGTSEEKIASSKTQNTLTSEVSLILKDANSTKTFGGKSSTQIGGKKILSIGEDASITQEIKDVSIARAFKAAYESAINTLKAQAE